MSNPPAQTEEPEDAEARAPGAVADLGGAQARSNQPIPRLPRPKGIRLTGPEVIRILIFLAMLVGVLALRQPCSDGIGRFIESFDVPDAGPMDAASASPRAPQGNPDLPKLPSSVDGYLRFTGVMSDEEIRAKLEQAGISAHDAGTLDATIPATE